MFARVLYPTGTQHIRKGRIQAKAQSIYAAIDVG
eukprot:IDg11441t1